MDIFTWDNVVVSDWEGERMWMIEREWKWGERVSERKRERLQGWDRQRWKGGRERDVGQPPWNVLPKRTRNLTCDDCHIWHIVCIWRSGSPHNMTMFKLVPDLLWLPEFGLRPTIRKCYTDYVHISQNARFNWARVRTEETKAFCWSRELKNAEAAITSESAFTAHCMAVHLQQCRGPEVLLRDFDHQ